MSEKMVFETPNEVKAEAHGTWATIELNETDIREILNHHPLLFDIGGNAKYMIMRVE